jgi:FkbM family methyltransferase
MSGAREWISGAFLRAPAPLRSIRRLPVIGAWMHRLSHAVLPAEQRHWAQIESGPGKGLWIELNPRTGEDYRRGTAEGTVQEILTERLRPGMVFYDLGANIGLFSLIAANMVGSGGRVFSFEPDAFVAERLQRNIARNNFANVTVVQKGVWSKTSTVNFVAADANSPDRGTGRFTTAESDGSSQLNCVSLDDFSAAHPAPDAIKCDVEGAELEVLRGAERLIRARRPWILGEMHSDENARAWVQFMRACGYSMESIDANHILAVP